MDDCCALIPDLQTVSLHLLICNIIKEIIIKTGGGNRRKLRDIVDCNKHTFNTEQTCFHGGTTIDGGQDINSLPVMRFSHCESGKGASF